MKVKWRLLKYITIEINLVLFSNYNTRFSMIVKTISIDFISKHLNISTHRHVYKNKIDSIEYTYYGNNG